MSLSRMIQRAALAAALLCGFAATASAQNILVVDRQRVLTESTVGQYVIAQLQPIQQQIEGELQGQFSTLQTQEQQLNAEASALTPETLQQRPDLLQRAQDLNSQYTALGQLENRRSQEYAQTRDQALRPVIAIVIELEEAILNERGATAVFDAGLAYHINPSADITQEVINRLNQRITTTPVTRVTLPEQQAAPAQ